MGDFRDGLTLEQRPDAIERRDRATTVYAVRDVPVGPDQLNVSASARPKLENTWKRCN